MIRDCIMGTFIVGLMMMTPGSFKRIIGFLYGFETRLGPHLYYGALSWTDSFSRLEKEGRIFCRDWEKYDSLNVVYQPLRMSVEELEKGMRRIWKECFNLFHL